MERNNEKAGFMGKITASVTHDIQNVFAIIKETSGLVEDVIQMADLEGSAQIDTRLTDSIKTIKKQAYRGVDLTSKLNWFAHTPDTREATIDVCEALSKTTGIADRLFRQNGVAVHVSTSESAFPLTTDPVLFQMIVFNCIQCLIDSFSLKDDQTIQVSGNLSNASISFVLDSSGIRDDKMVPDIENSDHWPVIVDLCNANGFRAAPTEKKDGILIFLN